MTGRLVALLVGIDAYPSPLPALAGCVNDALAFEALLRLRVPADRLDLTVLLDQAATRDAVIAGIRDHLGSARAGDVAFLHYSGHGSQGDAPPEFWDVEPDRRLETLVLVDSRLPGSWDLADKELAALLAGVTAGGAQVVSVLDCCHSGDGTRDADDAGRTRLAQADGRPRPAATFLPGTLAAASTSAAAPAPAGALRSLGATASGAGSQVLLAACRSSETAKETRADGRPRGALSAAVEAALSAGGSPTYRQLHRLATAAVLRRVAEQHPQLEATRVDDLDRPFLGGIVPPTPPHLVLAYLPDGWCIDAGAVHGIPAPTGGDSTELTIHAAAGDPGSPPLATARVTEVFPDRSLVALSATLDPSRAYRAVVASLPLPPLRVAVVGEDAHAAALRDAVAAGGSALVGPAPSLADADVVARSTGTGVVLTRPGVTRPVAPLVTGDDRVPRTIAALDHVARWLRLVDLRNPSSTLAPDAVRVRLEAADGRLAGDDGVLAVGYAGPTPPRFTVTVTNASDRTLWCALLDLTDAYGIFTDALPAGSAALGPGESVRVPLLGQLADEAWTAGVESATDHLKVVVSTLEFDPRSLQQEDLTVAGPAAAPPTRSLHEPRTTLERLLTRVTTRRLGPPAGDTPVADWRTDDYWVVTSRPRNP